MNNKIKYNIIKSLDIALQMNDIYQKKHYKYSHYYYSGETTFNIINVVFDLKSYKLNDKETEKIKSKIQKKHYLKECKILLIVIGDKETELKEFKQYSIIYLNYRNWKNKIEKVLPNIDFDSEFNILKAYEEQQSNTSNIMDLSSETGKKYNSFEHKKQINNLPIFISLLIGTVLIPLGINIFWMLYVSKSFSSGMDINEFNLLFGASNHDLLICLNQWWRIFTYPFISYGFFSIIFNLLILFLFIRFMEINIGKIRSVLLVCLYPVIGLIASMVSYTSVISGPFIIYALLLGGGAVSSYKKNDYASLMIKRSISFAIILFLIYSVFNFELINFLFTFFAFIVGCSFGLFINHHYNLKKDFLILVPIMIFILLFIVATVFVILEKFSKVIPPANNDVVIIVQKYISLHWMSQKNLDRLYSYYGIPTTS